MPQGSNPWAAIVGRRSEGRIGAVQGVVDALRAAGHSVCGFRQERVANGDTLDGYDLVDVETGQAHALARRGPDPDLCDWVFDAGVFEHVRERLMSSTAEVGLLELGPLEARGAGHWETVQALLNGPPRLALLCIRPQALVRIAIDMSDPVADLELPATADQVESFARDIASAFIHD